MRALLVDIPVPSRPFGLRDDDVVTVELDPRPAVQFRRCDGGDDDQADSDPELFARGGEAEFHRCG